MEEKELGMGWYKFLRYCSYGFMRFLLLLEGFLVLCFIIIDYSFENVISLFTIIIATVFSFAIHRHLENYSDKILDILLCVIVYDFIFFLFSVSDFGNALSSFILDLLLYFINRTYFRNRSHIFINKCNILGKPISVSE